MHGDTRLPKNFDYLVDKTLRRKNCAAGAFSLKIDSPGVRFTVVAYCANLRSSFLKMPYGDQAIFTSREMYNRTGGFAQVPIMEDYIFIKNIRKFGKIYILQESAVTSARRWQNMGVVRTTLINQLIVLGYKFGVELSTLAGLYQRLRGTGG